MALLQNNNVAQKVVVTCILLGFVVLAIVTTTSNGDRSVAGDLAVNEEGLTAIDTGDTAWMLMSSALVLLMTPGLAFFYGGMVRPKNVISTIFQSYIAMGIITVLWVFIGFSLAFGDDAGGRGVVGTPKTYYLYHNVGAEPNAAYAGTIPFSVYSVYQLMFAIITPALITGSFAERVRFPSFVLFISLWHIFVYCPLAHTVWHPKGLLRTWPTLDFAGGTVVHMASGYAALMGSVYLGSRGDMATNHIKTPANVPHVMLGTALLWFGWFGFNAGSALGAGALAGQAFLTTQIAAASSMCTWILLDFLRGHRIRATAACCGIVVGLVAITPAAGFVTVGGALLIGIIGSMVCFGVQNYVMPRMKVDDTLDAFSGHGVGGTIGTLLTGLFATTEVNSFGINGGFYGNGELFWHHLVMVFCVLAYVCSVSYFLYWVTDMIYPLRVDANDELVGLDESQHGERAMPEMLPFDSSVINGSKSGHTVVVGNEMKAEVKQ